MQNIHIWYMIWYHVDSIIYVLPQACKSSKKESPFGIIWLNKNLLSRFFRWLWDLLRVLLSDEAALAEPLSEPASAATFAFPAEPMEPGKQKNNGSKGHRCPYRIYVWYIYLHGWLIFIVNVGKHAIYYIHLYNAIHEP